MLRLGQVFRQRFFLSSNDPISQIAACAQRTPQRGAQHCRFLVDRNSSPFVREGLRLRLAGNINFVRGSILLSTLLFVTAIAVVSYSILALTMTNYRLSQRNQYLARARAVAESELEYVYFHWQSRMMQGATIGTPSDPAGTEFHALDDICVSPAALYTSDLQDPFCAAFKNTPERWGVVRSINCDIAPTASTDTSNKTSFFSYFTVQVRVVSQNSQVGPIEVRMGRRMNVQRSPIFQYNIFSQGNLEFAPGGTVTLNGDIAANGSIYLGASESVDAGGTVASHGTLQVNAAVRYLAIDPQTGVVNKYQTGTLANGASVYLPNGINSDGTSFSGLTHATDSTTGMPVASDSGDPSNQIKGMTTPINLLGGLDAGSIVKAYGDPLNSTPTNLLGAVDVDGSNNLVPDTKTLAAENLAYRAVISPPPAAVYNATLSSNDANNAYKSEYPDVTNAGALQTMADDPSIAALRIYNQAGLIITVNADGTTTWTARNSANATQDVTGSFSGVTDASGNPLLKQTAMYDLREGNQNVISGAPATPNNVQITQIDVGILATALTNSGLSFNGLLYVYLGNSDPSNPIKTKQLAAVRLVNGASTPISTDSQGNLRGFTVATNGGLYVQGNYNSNIVSAGAPTTTPAAADGSNANQLNPAMLMADAVTILSASWKDLTVTPQASSDGTFSAAEMAKTNVGPSSTLDIPANIQTDATGRPVLDSGGNIVAGGTTTVGAGILTGSITKDDSAGTYTGTPNGYIYSGGGHNLVRYVEDWSNSSVNIIGSIGRLFESTQYHAPFFSPGGSSNAKLNFPGIYSVPAMRTFTFDSFLQVKSPPGTPQSPTYSRGTLFTW
jgi:hypothetical protein